MDVERSFVERAVSQRLDDRRCSRMMVPKKVSATNTPAAMGYHGISVPCSPMPVLGSSGTSGGGGGPCARMIGSGNAVRLDDRREKEDDDCRDRLLATDRMLLRGTLDDCRLLLDCEKDEDDKEDEKEEELKTVEDTDTLLWADEVGTAVAQSTRVTVSVVTVPPNASARPDHVTFAPTVMPAFAITVPTIVVFAASVVACVGVQNTLHADAPLNETIAPAVDVSAPLVLNTNVPLPLSVNGPPIFIAPEPQ